MIGRERRTHNKGGADTKYKGKIKLENYAQNGASIKMDITQVAY
jgi:hypothetical protein